VDQAFAAGKLRASDVVSIYDSFKVPKLQRDFKALEIPDALAVMREATPE
jgi:hypothetical protein